MVSTGVPTSGFSVTATSLYSKLLFNSASYRSQSRARMQTLDERPNMPLRAILDRMRHDGCGGRAGKAELLTGIDEQPAGAKDCGAGG